MPAISVILPVYNSESYIKEAVESILKQTFEDFEFIIMDDGSTDTTCSYLKTIRDSRVTCIYNTKNSGNYKCRNIGLSQAKGKYICVMDADDIAFPDRLEKQYYFMENNPEYAAAGSDIICFSESNQKELIRLKNKDEIKVFLLNDNACTHPSMIIRKAILDKYNIRYNENFLYASDYNLMCDISHVGAITNLNHFLLKYRSHNAQITRQKWNDQVSFRRQIQQKQLINFQIQPSDEEIAIHLDLMNEQCVTQERLKQMENWCNKLLSQNEKTNYYDEEYLYRFLKERMMAVLRKSTR